MFSEYYLKARLMPAMLTMIPLVVLYVYMISPLVDEVFMVVWNRLPLIAGISLNMAILFFLVLLNRFVSKKVFQNLFYQDELYMPSTNMLMPDDSTLEKITKNRYYSLILADFGIDLKTDLAKLTSEDEKRKMIIKVVALIRAKLVGNRMLLRHNIEYGFWRNFLGGSILAIIVSVFLSIAAILNNNESVSTAGIVLFIVYFLPIVFSKLIVKTHGGNYANILFEQYEAMNRN